MKKRLFLGIEGGATKTTGVVTNEALRVLARRVGGPTNVHAVGRKAAWNALIELVDGLLTASHIGPEDLAAAAFCIAGIRTEEDRRAWHSFARKLNLGCRIAVTHDAAAGVAAGSPDEVGVLVVCGTGSLVYARRADGAERFVGGRGPLLGDEGSGFDIGHRALRAALRSADGRGQKSLLEHLVPERLNLDGLDALVPWVSPFAKERVASVAPIVFEAAEAGDGVARQIVEGAVGELARAVEVAIRGLWPPGDVPRVILYGGVLRAQSAMRSALAAAIRRFAPAAECSLPEVEGALGAARLARRLLGGHSGGAIGRASG